MKTWFMTGGSIYLGHKIIDGKKVGYYKIRSIFGFWIHFTKPYKP